MLETGALAVLYSPLWSCRASRKPCPPVTWLLRWLAFRFMLSSGIVKLTARDRTWQALTAMEYHFATTCLATFEAWFMHNLPPTLLRLTTAITFFVEIPASLLLLVPVALARRASAALQVLPRRGLSLLSTHTPVHRLP